MNGNVIKLKRKQSEQVPKRVDPAAGGDQHRFLAAVPDERELVGDAGPPRLEGEAAGARVGVDQRDRQRLDDGGDELGLAVTSHHARQPFGPRHRHAYEGVRQNCQESPD